MTAASQLDLIPSVLSWRGVSLVRDDMAEWETYETSIVDGWSWSVSATESGRYLASADIGPGRFDEIATTKEEALEKCRLAAIRRFRALLDALEAT